MLIRVPVLIVTPGPVRLQGVSGVTFMSALPNPLPSQQKKSVGRAIRPSKLNQYGRDPGSPSERLRASSDYDTEKGYSPLFHAFLADLPRLSSGNSCTLLLLTLWAKSAGRGRAKTEKRPEWTLNLSITDLAQICRCDVRTIEREIKSLEQRGLAEIRRPVRGEIEARLRYRDWESLADFKPSNVVEITQTEDVTPELTKEDAAQPGNQRVTGRLPLQIAAGASSKPYVVNCGVKRFRCKVEGPIDLGITAMVHQGELLVVCKASDESLKRVSSSHAFNNLGNSPRHPSQSLPTNGGITKPPQKSVTHPRAAELAKLFDPILAGSHARLLSDDSSSLLAACAAAGACDHNYLVKFAVQRAERPVKSPLHVKTICADALASWKASLLPGAVSPQNSGKKKGFVEDVMGVFARRLARDGKI